MDGTTSVTEMECAHWFSPEFQPSLVSVVLPTYNRAHLLPRALKSLLAQTYRPLEIIVVDDGSSDGTSEVLADFEARLVSESGITSRVITTDNQGAPVARNIGTRCSHGELIAFLDSDDVFASTKLSLQVEALHKNPTWRFCYGPVAAIEQPDKPSYGYRAIDWKDAAIRQLQWPFFSTLGPLFRREFLNRVGPWCETLERCQDWELHSRMVMARPDFGWVPNAWAYFQRDGHDEARVSARSAGGLKNPDSSTMRCRIAQIRSAVASAPAELARDTGFRRSLAWELLRLSRKQMALGKTAEGQSLLIEAANWSHETVLRPLANFAKTIFPMIGARPTVCFLYLCEWVVYRIYAVYLRLKRIREKPARRQSLLEQP